MTDPEQEFWAWAGRGILTALVGGFVWLVGWMWHRIHSAIPSELDGINERLRDKYATKDALVKLETDLKEAIAEQSKQRKEMHDENGKKLDTIREDISELRQIILEGERRSHARIDEHINRHHAK